MGDVLLCVLLWFSRFSRFSGDPTMGNLLKVLTCTDLEQEPNFFLDFESKFPGCTLSYIRV